MEDNSTKTIFVLIFIVIILGGILAFKVLSENSNNDKKTNTSESSYSKADIIELINSENNKSNYAVEYTLNNDSTYKIKYLNGKMKWEAFSSETNVLCYFDFEKNTNTIISEERKTAVIQEISIVKKNYIPEEILSIINKPDCIIEKEETVLNRNAIVLSYNHIWKIWIDAETGLLLQTIMNENDLEYKTVYYLSLNTVTINDVTLPDLSQYNVADTRSKQ